MELLVRLIADGLLLVILIVAGITGVYHVVVVSKQTKQYAPYAIVASLTGLLLAKLLSIAYQPSTARPYIEMGTTAGAAYIDNPGFPSDHALLATVVVIMLFALTPYRKLAITLAMATIIMSVGRVVALVHTPLDIVGGVVTAIVGAIWYLDLKKHK